MAKSDKLDLSRLLIGLAHECFNKAERTQHPEEAERLREMCRHFISEAENALNGVDGEPSSA